MFRDQYDSVKRLYPELAPRRTIHEIIRRMINRQVLDLIEHSGTTIAAAGVDTADAVRRQPSALFTFSPAMRDMHLELKRFLRTHLYQHYRVQRMTAKARKVIRELFDAFIDDVRLLPPDTYARTSQYPALAENDGRARAIADYIAGMTDRYAIAEHERIFSPMRLN